MIKIKKLTCGHEQKFSTPVPKHNETVFCQTCNDYSTTLKRERKPDTRLVSNGRPRRLKSNPRSNNQYTKGRELSV